MGGRGGGGWARISHLRSVSKYFKAEYYVGQGEGAAG